MSRSLKSRRVITLVLCTLLPLASHGDAIRETIAGNASFDSIGRAATPTELADWDSNIRDDFQGLKPGSGSVLQGKALYEDNAYPVMAHREPRSLFSPRSLEGLPKKT